MCYIRLVGTNNPITTMKVDQMKSPIVYIRCSTKQQANDEKGGVPVQLESNNKMLAKIDPQWVITSEEVEHLIGTIDRKNPTSGTTPHICQSGVLVTWDLESGTKWERVGFTHVRNMVETKKVSHLIYMKNDRLGRPQGRDGLWLTEFLCYDIPENNVELWYDGQKQETGASLASKLVMLLESQASGDDAERIKKATAPRRVQVFKDSGRQGGRLGYVHTKQSYRVKEIMHLTGCEESEAFDQAIEEKYVNPKETYLHRQHIAIAEEHIIPLVEEGKSAFHIAKYLNDRGIPTATIMYFPNAKWAYDTVKSIFRDTAFGRFTRKSQNEYRDEPTTLEFMNSELAAWPEEKVIQWRSMLNSNRGYRGPSGERRRVWLFSGRLKCPECGQTMVSDTKHESKGKQKGLRRFYYVCRDCKTGYLNADKLEQAFWHKFQSDVFGEKPVIIAEWERKER